MDQLGQLRQPYQQTPQQSMVWVSGEQEAMSYLVAPNSAVALWDSTAPVIYLKQADASGRPSVKAYELVERTQKAPTPAVEYAPLARLEALEARIEALAEPKTARKVKEGAE